MITTLSAATRITDLEEEYPFVMDSLMELSPKLKKLRNPILKKSIAKKATLIDVAKMSDIPLKRIFSVLADAIAKNAGARVLIENDEGAESSWQDELQSRQTKLKNLIIGLHSGADIQELQNEFKEILQDVSSAEIAEMEQSLISSGELSAVEVTALCDLHVQVFKETLDLHEPPESIPGHPVHTYMMENREAQRLTDRLKKNPDDSSALKELKLIILHYQRMQNQLFPVLERSGITGPSTVMWAKQDEIRDMMNNVKVFSVENLIMAIEEMIYKEENILFPMALETLSDSEWEKVKAGEEEIGFAWVTPGNKWRPITASDIHTMEASQEKTRIQLSTGSLTQKEIDLILRHLPFDLSFVGTDEKVAYYSATEDRIFPRSPGVIGRSVINCHPQKSFDKVKEIIDAFKDGTQSKAMFWIQLRDRFIIISYYAVRDDYGEFMGTLEVSQDATEIRSLQGEQRLLDWKA